MAWVLLAKRQRVVDSAKILLDIAKESADWFPPLKSALGGVNALIKHFEVYRSGGWMSCEADMVSHSNLKMSRRRSRSSYPSWIGSSKTSPRQRLMETQKRRIDARG